MTSHPDRAPIDSTSDEALWSRAIRGDGAAFGTVFDRNVSSVRAYCRRLVAISVDADDLTSMTFLETWRRRAAVRFVNGSIRPWLLATATNLARNAHRAARRYEAVLARLPRAELTTDIADQVAEDVDARQRSSRVRAGLATLRRQEREVIALCDMAGLSRQDASAALNVSVGTVKSRLSRGRARLRATLGDLDEPLALGPTDDLPQERRPNLITHCEGAL